MSQYNPPLGGAGGAGDVSKADIAQNVQFNGIIWVSGATYYGKNADTNIVVSSGLDAAHVISRTIAEVGSGFANQGINVLMKAGDYALTSGVAISGGALTLLGEGAKGPKTLVFADAITSKISGLFILTGHDQEFGKMEIDLISGVYAGVAANSRAGLNIHDIVVSSFDETLSGVFGVKLNSCSTCSIKDAELYSLNDSIHLNNSSSNHIEDLYAESFGTLVKVTGTGSEGNTIENVFATATDMLSGVVGLINSAEKNVVHNIHSAFEKPAVYTDAVSGTRRNKISDITNTDISGIEILNNSPNVNYIGAYYPDVGIQDVPRFTIWASGSLYQAIRNTDGVMISSGTNAANTFKTVMDAVGTSFNGLVHVKAGDYSFTSGWGIGGGVTLFGDPGGGTILTFDSASGLISGAIRVSGVRTAIRDIGIFGLSGVNPVIYTVDTTVKMDNVSVDSNDGTPASGHIGIHIAGGRGEIMLRNVRVFSHDTGIYVASGSNGIFGTASDIIIDGAEIGNAQCGILLDAAFQNIITNVVGDSSLTSGVLRLTNSSSYNAIDNIRGVSTSTPVVVLSSGTNENKVSNIINASGGPEIA